MNISGIKLNSAYHHHHQMEHGFLCNNEQRNYMVFVIPAASKKLATNGFLFAK